MPKWVHFPVLLCLAVVLYVNMPTPIAAATCQPPGAGETDITHEGSVSASTVFPGYPVSLSVDCETATSWFSTGPEPGGVPTVLRWNGARDDKITTLRIVSNHDHPEFPTNFGFGQVIVRVLDGANAVVYQETIPLPGTPDPDVELHPNVTGRSVELSFSGHESPDCGGIAELQIFADRTPPTPTRTQVPPTQTFIPPTAIPPTAIPPTEIPPTVPPTAVPPTEVPPTVPPTAIPPAVIPATVAPTALSPAVIPATTAPPLPTAISSTTVPPTSNNPQAVTQVPGTAATQAAIAMATQVSVTNALPGDCDIDNKVTELDALCALEMSVGLRAPLPQMDVDGDSAVTSRDAVILLERVVSK